MVQATFQPSSDSVAVIGAEALVVVVAVGLELAVVPVVPAPALALVLALVALGPVFVLVELAAVVADTKVPSFGFPIVAAGLRSAVEGSIGHFVVVGAAELASSTAAELDAVELAATEVPVAVPIRAGLELVAPEPEVGAVADVAALPVVAGVPAPVGAEVA
ncbi:MAG: hypothetical protein BYD32DRAFT_414143 [Podila humilis]|nr:MAG: hypothetical protein BYD32DRAFT_414143 [Podila humilis]